MNFLVHLKIAVVAVAVTCVVCDFEHGFGDPKDKAKQAAPELEAVDDKVNSEVAEAWEAYRKSVLSDLVGDALEAAKEIFINRLLAIINFNSNPLMKYTLGVNDYSHIAHDDFKKFFLGYQRRSLRNYTKSEYCQDWKDNLGAAQGSGDKDPENVDWRDKGVVSEIKNQKQCGSCWSFATTGAIESFYILKNKKNISLSEQNLIDCSKKFGNKGCNGGSMDSAFDYVIQNGGIELEEDYPYQETDRARCRFNPGKVAAKIKNYINLPRGDERALQKAVATVGPVSVAINAGHENFQSYQGGIYDNPDCDPDQIDHAVLLVGYGMDDGVPYYLIKNSWGTSWGLGGFMKVLRNHNNLCGLATEAQYPELAGDEDEEKNVGAEKDDKKDKEEDEKDKGDKEDSQKSLTSNG